MSMESRMRTFVIAVVLLLVGPSLALAAVADKDKAAGLQKTNTTDQYRPFTINNIFNYYGNNGDGSFNKYSTDNEGFEFPKGSGKHVIFEDGVVWGGFHKGRKDPKVGGSVYRHGVQAGKILTNGTATTDPTPDNPTLPKYRVYRVRPDINPKVAYTTNPDSPSYVALKDEADLIDRYESYSTQDLYNQYIKDWNEWPWQDGAPYTDVNHDGKYDPAVDIPGQPGADQTLWYVANDVSSQLTGNLAGCPPIGLEMQRTIWGYNRTGAIGNTIFASSLIINKSGAPIDSMFLVQWADPDLGDAGDDYVGFDTSRSLGFIYNGGVTDKIYGVAVPSGGFTFFQGPIVAGEPTDSAIFQLKYRHGFKNLKMSACVFFTQGSTTYGDPVQGLGGDIQWYNLMNGLIASTGTPFIDPKTGLPTKFTVAGDPVTGQGWNDGPPLLTPQDRRMCLVTGPIRMQPGDTQELVVANLAAVGTDRISSVAVVRYYSDLAQTVYNNLFNVPQAPPDPAVSVDQLNNEIVLSWSDPVKSAQIENFDSRGYKFEGYNVYQLPGPTFENPKRIATYDVVDGTTIIFDDTFDPSTGFVVRKPVQFGGDFTLSRSIDLTQDAIGQGPLVNGKPYYYTVTAYSYNPDPKAKPNNLESSHKVITVIPQAAAPGTRVNAANGQGVVATHATGLATGKGPTIKVVAPHAITGDPYQIKIVNGDSIWIQTGTEESPDSLKVLDHRWQLVNARTGAVVLPAPGNKPIPFGISNENPTIDGIQVGLDASPYYQPGHELGSQTYTPKANLNWTGVNAGLAFFGGGLDVGANFRGSSLAPSQITQSVEVRFTGNKATGQKAYKFDRTSAGTGAAKYAGFFPQPFTVWDVTNPASPRQIDFIFLESTTSKYFDSTWAPGAASGDREYFYFVDQNYTPTEKAQYAGKTEGSLISTLPITWAGWYTLTDATKPPYNAGDVWDIKPTIPVSTADIWNIDTAPLKPIAGNTDLAKADVEKINVWPNPYLGYSTLETNRYARFVTFSHLPNNAIIRIFNLSGVMVRSLVKSDNTQFMQWDLQNTSGFPVAAGMYIVHIEMPDLGKTKILKLGVIPEAQYLDRW